MDLQHSAEDRAFAAEVREWLTTRLEGDFAEVRDQGAPGREYEAVDARIAWEQELGRAGFVGMSWPKAVGGLDLSLSRQLIFWDEYVPRRRAGPHRRGGRLAARPDAHRARHRGAAAPVPPRHPRRHRALVPGILGARRRVGPREPADPGRARRRPVGDLGTQDLDVGGAPRALELRAVPHRRARQPAPRHLVPARADGPARRRGAADPRPHRWRHRLLRGVLRPRAHRRGERRRGGRRGLAGGDEHGDLRTRPLDRRLPAVVRGGAAGDHRAGAGERPA